MIGMGYTRFDTQCSISFLDRMAESEHQGWQGSTSIIGGYELAADTWNISPHIGVEYIYLSEDGFNETEADAVNLNISAKDSQVFQSLVGIKVEGMFGLNNVTLIPQLRADWFHPFDREAEDCTATFRQSGERFTIEGRQMAADSLELNLGLKAIFTERVTARLNYQYTIQDSDGYTANQVSMGLNYLF